MHGHMAVSIYVFVCIAMYVHMYIYICNLHQVTLRGMFLAVHTRYVCVCVMPICIDIYIYICIYICRVYVSDAEHAWAATDRRPRSWKPSEDNNCRDLCTDGPLLWNPSLPGL